MIINLIITLTLFYVLLLLGLAIGVIKIPVRIKRQPPKGISVIVAARNEEVNIAKLIKSISRQDYPADCFELIVVSDRSSDDTEKIVREHESDIVRLLTIDGQFDDNEQQPVNIHLGGKKRALAKGIGQAKFDILAFTDADCLPSPNWLKEINNQFVDKVDYAAGYSPLFSMNNNWLMNLKNLERLSIFAVSAGSFGWNYGLTCTARNIAYKKSLYEKVNGFKGIEDIPSGDDDLMLQRMLPHIRRMSFMFSGDSIVPSFDHKDITGQVNQETRRASKWKYYRLPIKIITAVVFLFYLSLIYLMIALVMGSVGLSIFLIVLAVKFLAEFLLVGAFAVRMKQIKYMPYFLLAELIYVPYFLFFAIKGTVGKYRWKD